MSGLLTVGTAGHIDHGKTAVVRALTGRETDRLAEEKRRGISIELGFAELDLGGRSLSLIDVPGHERLVRTMIAGATGIDFFLMTIAADDGVMPQTIEHLAVLRALGVDVGVLALTKCDLAEDRARADARQQAHELLPDAPLVEVSSRTGEGIEELRSALREAAARRVRGAAVSTEPEEVVLHVDRVFSVAGRGTVVTGTLWSGAVARGDRVTVLPQGSQARVREVQVHDRARRRAGPRQRVALNLAGIKRGEVERGSVVVGEGARLEPTYRLDLEIAVQTDDLIDHERVQVHHGTREAPARLILLDTDLAQLRLEAPLMVECGDRVVVRRIAPPSTLGGGRVLDANPRRHGAGPATARLRSIQEGDLDPLAGVGDQIAAGEPEPADIVMPVEPCASAPPRPDPLAAGLLAILSEDGAMPRGAQALADSLTVKRGEAIVALDLLVAGGEVVRVGSDVYYRRADLQALQDRIIPLIRSRGTITVAELRDALGVSRKYAQALLEHLDSSKITLRQGDERRLRRAYAIDNR